MSRPQPPQYRSRLLVTRLLTAGIAAASLAEMVFFALVFTATNADSTPSPVVAALILNFAVPILGGVVAFLVGLRTLRVINGLTVIGILATLPTWHPLVIAPAVTSGSNPSVESGLPWIVLSSAPLAVAAVLSWNTGPGWIVLFGASLIKPVAILATTVPNPTAFAAFDSVLTLLSSVLLGGLSLALLASSRRLDAAACAATALSAQSASEQAWHASRDQANALVHDDVLSTLLFGAANDPRLRQSVAAGARTALGQIEALSAPHQREGSVPVSEFVSKARSITSDLDSTARFVSVAHGTADLPEEAADALYAALTQSLTNSVSHAGSRPGESASPGRQRITRTVTVTVESTVVEVRVHDDGRGFAPAQVRADRLGIAVSIVARMRSIAGGDARTTSQPGYGTTVTLHWAPPRLRPLRTTMPASQRTITTACTTSAHRWRAGSACFSSPVNWCWC